MNLGKIIDKIYKPVIRFGQAASIALAIYATSIPVTCAINNRINEKEHTVVFTNSGFLTEFVNFFMYTPVTLRENIRGNSVKWVNNATKEEVINHLQNPDYQNIVFIGHGDGHSFLASDGPLTTMDIFDHNIPKKGELILYTCGSKNKSLKYVLLENLKNYHDFDEKVNTLTLTYTAWAKLFD